MWRSSWRSTAWFAGRARRAASVRLMPTRCFCPPDNLGYIGVLGSEGGNIATFNLGRGAPVSVYEFVQDAVPSKVRALPQAPLARIPHQRNGGQRM